MSVRTLTFGSMNLFSAPRSTAGYRAQVQPGSRRVRLALCVITVVLGATYLAMINAVAVSGFKIQAMEQQLQDIEQTRLQLQQRQLSMQSLSDLQARASAAAYVELGDLKHLQSAPAVVAQK